MTSFRNDNSSRRTAAGVFRDRDDAKRAIDELKDAGFRDSQIGYAARDDRNGALDRDTNAEKSGDTASGAVAGAVTGGVLGAVAGAAAALLIPGVGPVVAGGILASALGGAAIGAAGGGIIGALMNSGVEEHEARYYDEEFRRGGTVVTVQSGADRYDEAMAILRRNGASFYDRAASGTYTAPQRGAQDVAGDRMSRLERQGTVRVPEVEERLDVDKRQVQTGEVRIHKDVKEERQTVPVELMREEVHVDKRDVERPVRDGEDAFKEETIRVPVRAEEAVAHKEAVVTGEVVVNKERTTQTEQVGDTVRRTEVHVDRPDETVHPDRQEVVGAATGTSQYRYQDYAPRFRSHWDQNYRSTGLRYEDYDPAYHYGFDMANDPRYRGRRWEDVEPELRRDWETRYHDRPWNRFADSVRHAWNSMTGAAASRR